MAQVTRDDWAVRCNQIVNGKVIQIEEAHFAGLRTRSHFREVFNLHSICQPEELDNVAVRILSEPRRVRERAKKLISTDPETSLLRDLAPQGSI